MSMLVKQDLKHVVEVNDVSHNYDFQRVTSIYEMPRTQYKILGNANNTIGRRNFVQFYSLIIVQKAFICIAKAYDS